MSKTYYNRHQMRKENDGIIEYSPEFEEKLIKSLKKREYSDSYTYEDDLKRSHRVDVSNTLSSSEIDWLDINRKNSRHPNKRKHSTLTREFKGTGANEIKYWRFRMGQRTDKSDRMGGWRHISSHARRTAMKRNDQRLIEEELNNK